MDLTIWNPWREMDDLFERYTRAVGPPRTGGQELLSGSEWAPKVDISENDGHFEIKAELPEVKKEDVNVKVDNGILTISGERKQEKEEKDTKFHRIERSYGCFSRSFTLPDNVDEAKIKASFKDGMLNLQIPKTEKAKPKGIEVKVE